MQRNESKNSQVILTLVRSGDGEVVKVMVVSAREGDGEFEGDVEFSLVVMVISLVRVKVWLVTVMMMSNECCENCGRVMVTSKCERANVGGVGVRRNDRDGANSKK